MARKTKLAVISEEGRDKGKTFLITEPSSTEAYIWARHCLQAIARTGIPLPEDIQGAGVAGLQVVGFRALLNMPPGEVDSLLAQMMGWIRIVRDTTHPEIAMPLMEEDIEEIKTHLTLQMEAFELISGFSLAGVKQKLTSTPAKTSEG